MSLQHAVYAVLIIRRGVILETECKNFLCRIVCLEVEPQKGVEDGRFACCGHVSSGVDQGLSQYKREVTQALEQVY